MIFTFECLANVNGAIFMFDHAKTLILNIVVHLDVVLKVGLDPHAFVFRLVVYLFKLSVPLFVVHVV